jgi:hypothetical protein
MEIVWELEKIDVENALLTMKDGASGIKKCWEEQISKETRGYFMKRVREKQLENMEEEVAQGLITEGNYIENCNRLAKLTTCDP